MKTLTPEKRTISAQIEACIFKASKHFKYDRPVDVLTAVQLRSVRGQKARAAVWQHMIECNYSCRQIGRIFRKDPDLVRKYIRTIVANFDLRDMEFIRSLPFVDGGKESP